MPAGNHPPGKYNFMTYAEIQQRLLQHLRERVHNGHHTERGFARQVGISQPHIHKVLKGSRTLSLENSDWILQQLRLSLLDFLTGAELEAELDRRRAARQDFLEVAFAEGQIGPGKQWNPALLSHRSQLIPRSLAVPSRRLVAARLERDDDMDYSWNGWNSAVVELADRANPWRTGDLYVVEREREAVIRRVRPGLRLVYLAADRQLSSPLEWQSLERERLVVVGRVIWIGRGDAVE